jgi:hypothetical protein
MSAGSKVAWHSLRSVLPTHGQAVDPPPPPGSSRITRKRSPALRESITAHDTCEIPGPRMALDHRVVAALSWRGYARMSSNGVIHEPPAPRPPTRGPGFRGPRGNRATHSPYCRSATVATGGAAQPPTSANDALPSPPSPDTSTAAAGRRRSPTSRCPRSDGARTDLRR